MPSAKRDSLFFDFISYATVILQGGGFEELLSAFKDKTQTGVCLRFKKRVVISTQSSVFEEQVRTYPYKELLSIFHHVELEEGCEVIFDLTTDRAVMPAIEKEIEHLCLALRLLRMGERRQQLIEQRYREQFVQDLLFSRIHYEEELRNRSSLYGWNLSGGVVVLIAEFHELTKRNDKLFPLLKGRIKLLYPDMIFSDGKTKIIFLIPLSPGRQIKKDLQLVLPTLKAELGEDVYLALSGEHSSFLETGEAYKEASQALSIAKSFLKKNSLIFWEDLGAYKLLSDMVQNGHARQFVSDMLAPLTQADKNYRGELMKTLQMLERCGWNFSLTAQKLHVHYNTLKYRYKKIKELLHLDEKDSEQRFSITLALHLYRMCNSDSHNDVERTL